MFFFLPLYDDNPITRTPVVTYALIGLCAIVFLWQVPHTLAIGRLYQEDYARAGIRILPVVDPEGRSTERQIVVGSLARWAVALLPSLVGLTGSRYFFGAVALGGVFLVFGIVHALGPSRASARQVVLASVLHLPLLFALMAFDAHRRLPLSLHPSPVSVHFCLVSAPHCLSALLCTASSRPILSSPAPGPAEGHLGPVVRFRDENNGEQEWRAVDEGR